jgi:uncharacterized protein (DUF2249 family)
MTATLIQPTFELDLRTIPPRERHPLIFGRFDALADGPGTATRQRPQPAALRYQFEDRALRAVRMGHAGSRPVGLAHPDHPHRGRRQRQPAGAKGDSCCSGGACCG